MNFFYLKYTLRKIQQGRFSSIIKIFGLAIGIAASTLILFWIQDELSFDNFHENKEKIHRLVVTKAGAASTEPLAESLGELGGLFHKSLPQIEKYSRLKYLQKTVVHYRDKKYYEEEIAAIDSTFFEVFSFSLEKGNIEDVFRGHTKVALSETMAKKYFGDNNPIGKIVFIDSIPVKVSGVFKDIPANSHLGFDMLCSMDLLKKLGYTHVWGYYTYFLIDEDVDKEALVFTMNELAKERNSIISHFSMELGLQELKDIHFNNSFGSEIAKTGDKQKVYIFTVIAFFILIVASLNYVNLNIAENTRDINDLAVMKALGAKKRQILVQYVIDAVVFLSISCVFALAIIEFSHPFFGKLMGNNLRIDYIGVDSLMVLTVLAIVALLTILPMFYLSRYSPRNIMQFANSIKKSRLSFRIVLVIVQFSISMVLILSMLFTSRQIQQMVGQDAGYNHENLMYFPARKKFLQHYDAVKHELLAIPSIESVTMSSCLPFDPNRDIPRWEGKADNVQVISEIYGVDFDFAKTLGLRIKEGRDFSRKSKKDELSGFLISEEAAKQLEIKDPIGKKFGTSHKNGNIIGVFENLRFQSYKQKQQPQAIFIQDDYSPVWLPNRGVIIVRYKDGAEKQTIKKAEKIWNSYNKQEPFEYSTFDQSIAKEYQEERKTANLYLIFSALAIIISCLGLFGLSAFMSNQRAREICIRKVNGASISKIIFMLSKVFVKWVIVSFIVACPIAFYLIDKWLQNFAIRTNMHWWIFAIAGFGVMIIALITVLTHTYQAARRNPVDVLRYE